MATHDSLINDGSLRAHPDGMALELQIPWYRSLWLSAVNSIALTLDGQLVPTDHLRFELSGRSYTIPELREQSETLWYLRDHALLVAALDVPLAAGTSHRVDVTVDMSILYMQIRPGLYVPNRVSMVRDLEVLAEGSTWAPELLVEPVPPPADRSGLPFKLGLTLYSATAELRGRPVRLRLAAREGGEFRESVLASRSSPRRWCPPIPS